MQALPPADEGGFAILNRDDPLVRSMAALTRARVFTYGLDPDADVWADEISGEGLEGIRFRFHQGRELLHVHLPMLGRHSVHTALRAAAVGLAEGLSWTEIIAGLREVRGQLRLMVVPGLRGTTIIDDTYNASPASMLAALNLLEDIANREHRAVAVLGDMLELGAYEAGRASGCRRPRRPGGGETGHCGDHEHAGSRDGALATGMDPTDVYPTENNEDAIAVLQGLIRSGDIVLVKGSRALGMETIVDALSRQARRDSDTHV